MKTYWKLSENAWEYWGDIYITSKEMPTVKKVGYGDYEMNVDGVTIKFDEEIRFVEIVDGSEVTTMPDKKLTEGTTPIDYEGTLKSLTESYYDALDLINRLQAENERLLQKLQQAQKQKDKLMDAQMFLAKTSDEQQAEIERLTAITKAELDTIHDLGNDYERVLEEEQEIVKRAKSEARKEFAERLKHIIMWSPKNHISITAKDLDNLLKEMERADNV